MRIYLIFFFLISVLNISVGQTAEDFFQEGLKYVRSEEYTKAIISYTEAILLNPYEWNYYRSRSAVLYETKSYDKALMDINKALKLKPKHENDECLYLRSSILIELRKYTEAIDDLSYILKYFSKTFISRFGVVHLDRGKAYLYSGQKDKACLDFHESSSRRMADARKMIDEFCK